MTNAIIEELKTLADELRTKLAEVETSIENFLASETSEPVVTSEPAQEAPQETPVEPAASPAAQLRAGHLH